jgi:uncharacterized repeat protein (TIGR03803 family)
VHRSGVYKEREVPVVWARGGCTCAWIGSGSQLLAADGNFYGIIGPGGSTIAGAGIIFKIMHNNMFLILHRFTGADGAGPYYGALLQGADGLLYGVTGSGGTSGNGTFFRFDPGR